MAIIAELNPEIKHLIDNIELSDDIIVEDLAWVFYRLEQAFDPVKDFKLMTAHVQYLCTRIEDTHGIESARAIMLLHVMAAYATEDILHTVKNISTFH
jgi:hypothetical protein